MFKNKSFLLVLFVLVLSQYTVAQNNTNSPYTRFGYGDLNDSNSGEQRAMGGVALGSRSNKYINNVNPASYSAVDSMTFMFDLGASALISRFSQSDVSKNKFTSNLDYISMQFPLYKWLGFSAGLNSYSSLGYDFSSNDTVLLNTGFGVKDSVYMRKDFSGTGGISQVYTGLSASFLDHISLGLNVYYMFGNIQNIRNLSYLGTSNTASLVDFNSATQLNTITANSFRYRFGAQFYNTFNEKHDLTLGLIYEHKAKLDGKFSQINYGSVNDTLEITGSSTFETPTTFGAGLYYTYDNRISVGLDYSLQQWQDSRFFGLTDSLTNRSKIALGLEYINNPRSRKFIDKVHYRAGVNISDSYYKIDGQIQPKNFGISFGLGLPLYNKATNSTSLLNTTFEYGKIGTSNTLREDYFKFTLNVIFNEHWFFKRKL